MTADLVQCPLCERDCPRSIMSEHHLRTRKADAHLTELVCRDCHSCVHRLFSNKELAAEGSPLGTVKGLKENFEMAKALAFFAKRDPHLRSKHKTSRRKREQRRRR